MRISKLVSGEVYKWLVLSALAALVLLTTGLANRNVYSKSEVDNRIGAVRTLHMSEQEATERQLDRIEGQVDRLVDVLIEDK